MVKKRKKDRRKTNSKKENKKFYFLISRYLITLIFTIIGASLFHYLFKPLTVYPSFFLLDLFYDVVLEGIVLNFPEFIANVHIVEACIAGSGYLLLLILSLTTPMKIKKRLQSLLFLFSSFLTINILRIFIFSIIFLHWMTVFNILHMATWYFLSAVFVFVLWIVNINIFKIKEIPVYTDFKFLLGIIKKGK